jgi:hypothetical protein
MAKRPAIPQKMREAVLKEFNHRCAICGERNPHLHHIDENPENNAPLNLLPLCPNCHLTDQHAPTAKLQPEKLALFRKHKDPTILVTEFEPLFRRLRYLDEVKDNSDIAELEKNSQELVEFVYVLAMGMFYGQQIEKLVKKPFVGVPDVGLEGVRHEEYVVQCYKDYRNQLRNARDQVYWLAVEMLRYQPWSAVKKSDKR